MKYKTNSIASRIEWCQRQSTQARTQFEREGWQAEVEGLRDALLKRVHTNQYQHCPPGVYKRYVIGFQDGEALIRAAAVDHYFATPDVTHKTQAGAHGER